LRLLVRTEEYKSVKEFVCFSTTDVLYQLVNLVLETCLIFSKILKFKQDIFVLSFSFSSSIRTTSVMIPLFQIFFGTKVFKKMLILECLGVLFCKVNCGVYLGFLTHLFQKDV
jgi:hypothetical protein